MSSLDGDNGDGDGDGDDSNNNGNNNCHIVEYPPDKNILQGRDIVAVRVPTTSSASASFSPPTRRPLGQLWLYHSSSLSDNRHHHHHYHYHCHYRRRRCLLFVVCCLWSVVERVVVIGETAIDIDIVG